MIASPNQIMGPLPMFPLSNIAPPLLPGKCPLLGIRYTLQYTIHADAVIVISFSFCLP